MPNSEWKLHKRYTLYFEAQHKALELELYGYETKIKIEGYKVVLYKRRKISK